jgi:hypothetical protein
MRVRSAETAAMRASPAATQPASGARGPSFTTQIRHAYAAVLVAAGLVLAGGALDAGGASWRRGAPTPR